MKSLEEIEKESWTELVVNSQKCVHLDTGGRGDHIPLAKRVREAASLEEASNILVEYEDMRMSSIRKAQNIRLDVLKKRIKDVK